MNGIDRPDEMTVGDYLAVDRAVAEVFGREPTLTREELEATATFPHRKGFDPCPPYGCPERRPRVQDREPPRRADGGKGVNDAFIASIRRGVRAMRRAAFEAGPQWSLGQLIDALEAAEDPTVGVRFDFCSARPTKFDSYRGYYDELALGWTAETRRPTVAEVLADARSAVGATFAGYKGGDFVMDRDTPVWVANHGETGSTAVVGVSDLGWGVVVRTAYLDD